MEVAGLAIGVAGLTALFDTCLNLIDRVETYRDFERDSHYLATRFKAEKLRLEQWGHAVDQSAGVAKTLWIHGSAGCGKTVLCAKIAEHLVSTSATPVAHFFLSSESEGRDDPYLAVRSWIAQIISSDARAFDAVSQEFRGQHEQIASRATMVRLLKEVLQAAPSCTLILDGLDECTWMRQSQKWGESMTDFLDSILDAAATADVRFLLVCRDEPEIRRSLDETDHMEVKISMEDVGADISLYAKSIVDKKLPRKDQSTREELAQRMAGRCKGQFLWLRMQAESLRGTKNKKQLESIIDEAPSRLGHLYERNWERILQLEYKDRTRAISLIRWAAFSIRPLTVSEITEAVLIDESCIEFPLDQMPDEIDEEYISDEIVGLCGSLLEVRSSSSSPLAPSKTVHIAHFSVKQFFLSHHHTQGGLISANGGLRYSNESLENTVLAELCLTYINYQHAW
ncbi:ankyrin-1, partial [Thozetella sp. PMI_491]